MGRTSVLAVLAMVGFAAALAARQAQAPTFKAGVDLVQLDVSVLDKDGNPVRGLKAEDFTVLENGTPQQVVAFAPVDVADAATAGVTDAKRAAWTHQVSPDVVTNQLDNRRLVMLVLDDATLLQGGDKTVCNLPPDSPFLGRGGRGDTPPCANAGAEELAQDAARQVIDQLGPNDLASVAFTWPGNPPQDFTGDRVRLNAAVDRFMSESGPSCLNFQGAIRALNSAVDALISVPDRRKALVYVGAGVPVDFTTERLLVNVPDDINKKCGLSLVAMLKEVFISAQRANVNIYTIDPLGLRTYALPGTAAAAEVDSQKITASNTGGRAIVETNDFTDGIAQMFRENSSYYLVGYAPSHAQDDGTFRRIEVKVDQPHVEVRTRKSYYAPDAKKLASAAKTPPPSASVSALTHVLPKTDVSLAVTAAPFEAAASSHQASVSVVLGVDEPSPATTDDLEISVAALDGFGKVTTTTQQTVHTRLTPQPTGLAHTDAVTTLTLAPGSYELLVGAASRSLGKSGSVYADVDVPDFAKDAVTLSGVVLYERAANSPGQPSPPQAQGRAGGSTVPTTLRTFAATDQVSAFVQIYEGGKNPLKAVTLHTRVTDEADRVMVDASEAIDASRFDPTWRAGDDRIDLPLGRLTPGRYLLSVEATVGKTTAERDVVFAVR